VLSLEVSSRWAVETAQLIMNPNPRYSSKIQTKNFASRDEFDLNEQLLFHAIVSDPGDSMSGAQYSVLRAEMSIKRLGSYYFWNIVLPMFALVTLSFTSFQVTSDQASNRLSISLTLLLTAVAFKYVVSEKLPNVNYLTLMDKYVLVCELFLVAVVLLDAYDGSFFGHLSNAGNFDSVAPWVLFSLWMAFHAAMVILVVAIKSEFCCFGRQPESDLPKILSANAK